MSQIKSIGELEAKGFVRQSDGSYRKQRLCAKQREPACHPGSCLGNENRSSEPEATRGDLSGAGAVCGSTAKGMTPKTGTRIRQSKKPLMNKLEAEWFHVLKDSYPEDCHVVAQAMRFKLGNGINYKPDFVVFGQGSTYAYEVKGPHAFRGGFENLKVAASLYPWIKWYLVWKQDGAWMEQEVLP